MWVGGPDSDLDDSGGPPGRPDMGSAWGRLYSQFPPVIKVTVPATDHGVSGVTACPSVRPAAAPLPPALAAVSVPGCGSSLPLWVRQFWLGTFVGGLPPPGGRAQSWVPGERSAPLEDSFRALPHSTSRGCAVAAVLALPRRVGDCEVCGRSLRGRLDIQCQSCGRRLCDTFCVRLCHRAARLDSLTGSLNELARGCAARFCAHCEPAHFCSRVEPQRVAGWKCSHVASQPVSLALPPPSRVPGGTGPHRRNSCPPGGGRVVPLLGPSLM